MTDAVLPATNYMRTTTTYYDALVKIAVKVARKPVPFFANNSPNSTPLTL
jgi:hypothetical protein